MATKTEETTLPGFGTDISKMDISNYAIRYKKVNLDEPGDVTDLELIETKSLKGDEIVLINKDKFTFMDKYFIIITYLERTAE